MYDFSLVCNKNYVLSKGEILVLYDAIFPYTFKTIDLPKSFRTRNAAKREFKKNRKKWLRKYSLSPTERTIDEDKLKSFIDRSSIFYMPEINMPKMKKPKSLIDLDVDPLYLPFDKDNVSIIDLPTLENLGSDLEDFDELVSDI